MCQEPITTLYVGYIPRVGDLIWSENGTAYKALQVAQWGEPDPDQPLNQSGRGEYMGRICVMVEIHAVRP